MAPASTGVATGLTLEIVFVDACKAAVGGSDRCWPTVQNGAGANSAAGTLLRRLGFAPISETLRMYRGSHPEASLADVYGLACLGLG